MEVRKSGQGRGGERDREDPDRYVRLAVSALARRVLSQGITPAARAGVPVAAVQQRRGQRDVLFAAAAGALPRVVRRDAGGLRLRGQGWPLHHAYEATARRRDRLGELLRLGRTGPRRQARPVLMAAAAPPRVRSRPARAVLRAAATHHRRGRATRREPRQQAEEQAVSGSRETPETAARTGSAPPEFRFTGSESLAAQAQDSARGRRYRREVATTGGPDQ